MIGQLPGYSSIPVGKMEWEDAAMVHYSSIYYCGDLLDNEENQQLDAKYKIGVSRILVSPA